MALLLDKRNMSSQLTLVLVILLLTFYLMLLLSIQMILKSRINLIHGSYHKNIVQVTQIHQESILMVMLQVQIEIMKLTLNMDQLTLTM